MQALAAGSNSQASVMLGLCLCLREWRAAAAAAAAAAAQDSAMAPDEWAKDVLERNSRLGALLSKGERAKNISERGFPIFWWMTT